VIERFKSMYPMFDFLLDEGFVPVEIHENGPFGAKSAFLQSESFLINIGDCKGRGEVWVRVAPYPYRKSRLSDLKGLEWFYMLQIFRYLSGQGLEYSMEDEYPYDGDDYNVARQLKNKAHSMKKTLPALRDFLKKENFKMVKEEFRTYNKKIHREIIKQLEKYFNSR